MFTIVLKKTYFRYGKAHGIITIAQMSRKVVINCDYPQSREISSNMALSLA